MLSWLRKRGCQWTASTSYAAFEAGHLDALCWLQRQDPPCPWTPLQKHWKYHPSGHRGSLPAGAATLPARRLELLQVVIQHLTTPNPGTADAAQAFLEERLIETLDGLSSTSTLMLPAVVCVATSGHLGALAWLLKHYPPRICRLAQICTIAARTRNLQLLQLLGEHQLSCSCETGKCMRGACRNDQRAMLTWLRKHGCSDVSGCLHAAEDGNLDLLQWMRSQCPPWPWPQGYWGNGGTSVIAACRLGRRDMLAWLREHGCTDAHGCLHATQWGDLALLKWMRSQVPPWPWGPELFHSLLTDVKICMEQHFEVLRWLLDQYPACPWPTEPFEVRLSLFVDTLPYVQNAKLMEMLHRTGSFPDELLPIMCSRAAEHGNLAMLRCLVLQQPGCSLASEVCQHALDRDDVMMVHFLVAERAPATFPNDTDNASPACLLELWRAGRPMRVDDDLVIPVLLKAWCTFMGLHRWADAQAGAWEFNLLQDGAEDECAPEMEAVHSGRAGNAADPLTSSSIALRDLPQHKFLAEPQAPNSLLMDIAKLPPELRDKIACDALLSPREALFLLSL